MSPDLRAAWRWLPFALAATGCGYAVWRIASLPPADLSTYVADDTFYYLVLARNLAATGQLTFDGVNSASGFHPAWLATSALLSACGLDGISLVRAVILLAFLCHLASALLIIRIARDSGAPPQAEWAGALWMANPVSLMLVGEAMETSLFVAALAGACVLVQRLVRSQDPAAGALARASIVFGVLCLVRTDGVVVAGVAIVLISVVHWLRTRQRRRAIAIAAALAIGPAVVLVAFTLWLRWQTGYFTQASGELKVFWGATATAGDKLAFLYHVMVRLTFGAFGANMVGLPTKVSALAGGVALAWVIVSAWNRFRRGDMAPALLPVWVITAAAVASTLYALVLFEYRAWYLGLPTFAVFLGVVLEAGRRMSPRAFAVAAAIVLVLMGLRGVQLSRGDQGRYPYARAIYESVEVFDAIVPAGAVIASFDAGLRGFFATHRVINLDGLVNDATRPYWRAGRLDLYLERENVEYVADEPGNFDVARRFTAFPAVDPVSCLPVRGTHYRDRCLWRVRR